MGEDMKPQTDEQVINQVVEDLTPKLDPYQRLGMAALSWLAGRDFSSMPMSQVRKLLKAKIKEVDDGD